MIPGTYIPPQTEAGRQTLLFWAKPVCTGLAGAFIGMFVGFAFSAKYAPYTMLAGGLTSLIYGVSKCMVDHLFDDHINQIDQVGFEYQNLPSMRP